MPRCDDDTGVIVCLQVIVFSMVRSNAQGDVGFLSEQRRNNVAITRARRLLCVLRVRFTSSCFRIPTRVPLHRRCVVADCETVSRDRCCRPRHVL